MQEVSLPARIVATLLVAACLQLTAAGAAQVPATEVEIHGLDRTRRATVLDLLPRPPPAMYSDTELREFERRLGNLGIFDRVEVRRSDGRIRVELREKWTLIPMVDFASGSSWEDTYAALSVSEYNFLGLAALLSASVWHEERGWNAALGLQEHNYHPNRGSWGFTLEYASASYFFEDSPDAWDRIGAGGGILWSAPLPHGSYFAYRIGLGYQYERNVAAATNYKPPDGHSIQSEFLLSWDRFSWDDLAPDGAAFTITFSPGTLITEDEPQLRLGGELQVLWAHAFSDTTVVMGQILGSASSLGNANFSTLLGSIDGVRGLEDALYRTWLRASTNLEMRQSFRVFERWALQGVAFADAAVFETITARGGRGTPGSAASIGLGVRVIPTFIAEVVLRVDMARTLWPDPGFFVQWALSQYF